MIRNSTAQRIKNALKETGLKQTYLANKLGISPQQLSYLLQNNFKRTKYLPKIAETLGVSESWLKNGVSNKLHIVQVLSKNDFLSLVNKSVNFEELIHVTFESIPAYLDEEHYHFAFKTAKPVNKEVTANDLILFNTIIPLRATLNGCMGIVYIKAKNEIFIGAFKYEKDKVLSIYNDSDCIKLSNNDLILGIAKQLTRNLEISHGN